MRRTGGCRERRESGLKQRDVVPSWFSYVLAGVSEQSIRKPVQTNPKRLSLGIEAVAWRWTVIREVARSLDGSVLVRPCSFLRLRSTIARSEIASDGRLTRMRRERGRQERERERERDEWSKGETNDD